MSYYGLKRFTFAILKGKLSKSNSSDAERFPARQLKSWHIAEECLETIFQPRTKLRLFQCSSFYLIDFFRKHFGVTPTVYRKDKLKR